MRKRDFDNPAVRRAFFDSYERELIGSTESRQAVQLLAAISLRTRVSIGCFCADESRCHRSRLKKILEKEARRQRDE
jgi:uncharacterized protein YeaO (DUF488 family)